MNHVNHLTTGRLSIHHIIIRTAWETVVQGHRFPLLFIHCIWRLMDLDIAGTLEKKEKLTYLLTLLTRKLSQIARFWPRKWRKTQSKFYSNFFPKPPSSGLAAGLAGWLPRQRKAAIVHRKAHSPGRILGLFPLVKWLLFYLPPDRPLQCHWSWMALWLCCCRAGNGVSADASLLVSPAVCVCPPTSLPPGLLLFFNKYTTCNIYVIMKENLFIVDIIKKYKGDNKIQL